MAYDCGDQNNRMAARAVRLLMCGYAPGVLKHRVLLMLKCFADDSGSHKGDESKLFVLAGYLLEESEWEGFAENWDKQLKRDFPVKFFHMADAEYGDGPFEGMREEFRRNPCPTNTSLPRRSTS